MEVALVGPNERSIPRARDAHGYHRATAEGVAPGARYLYRLDGTKQRPDPASRCQPDGVHGPSQVTDTRAYDWQDGAWSPPPLERFVIYELHIGTFTEEGTFDAVIPHLDTLKELGVTAVEIMPVAQFPGERNWGYDGVDLYAAQHSYGGPAGLQRLVDACHQRGLAAILDVVYNHLGPEGNYLSEFGPYFTDRHTTLWGAALNFDGAQNAEVRRFFIENALQWLVDFHFDALRLDAVHAIKDDSAYPFLRELAETVHRRAKEIGRPLYLIAENELDNSLVIQPPEQGGYGMDAQWSDDFHHALHVLLTSERSGYYAPFAGIGDLARAIRDSANFDTGHPSPRYPHRAALTHGQQFVVCAQNHDQVGNRAAGDRLSQTLSYDALKLAAGAVILSPYIPLLFMGEEYGEPAPFQFFTSHGDADLIEAVRRGRRAEFAAFRWQGEVPDPHDTATFARSKLSHRALEDGPHGTLWQFYRELLRLRRSLPPLASLDLNTLAITYDEATSTLMLQRWAGVHQTLALFNFSDVAQSMTVEATVDALDRESGAWAKALDSMDEWWRGTGSTIPAILPVAGDLSVTMQPMSFVLFTKDR